MSNLRNIRSVDVIGFIPNNYYIVEATPDTMVTVPVTKFSKKWPFIRFTTEERRRGSWCITDREVPGQLHYDLETLSKNGMTVHDGKVCFKPRVVIEYANGYRAYKTFNTVEEANAYARTHRPFFNIGF